MKNSGFYSVFTLLIFIAAGMLAVSGCKKDDNNKTAPAIPPKSGFVMDFNGFSTPNDTLKSAQRTDTYSNWGYSYMNVAAWNTVLVVGLAVPVASFTESFKHEAIYHPDVKNWTWSYNFNAGFTQYMATLKGEYVGDSTSWEMRITKAGAYSDFLWYSGKASISQSGGYWILMESPETSGKILRIDWNKFNDGTSDIKYTNIKQGNADNGSYIYYGTTLGSFDRFYQIYNRKLSNLTIIEWASTLHNGHVKDPLQYKNNAWHCWDYKLKDIVCQ